MEVIQGCIHTRNTGYAVMVPYYVAVESTNFVRRILSYPILSAVLRCFDIGRSPFNCGRHGFVHFVSIQVKTLKSRKILLIETCTRICIGNQRRNASAKRVDKTTFPNGKTARIKIECF